MRRLIAVLGCLAAAAAAQADETPPPATEAPPPAVCTPNVSVLVSHDQGTATIDCTGVSAGLEGQLADILTQVLQNRLDPEAVLSKLADIESTPEEGKLRTVDATQRQAILQALVGKPTQEIAIVADAAADDSGSYGKDIAGPLLMLGWQIEGNQIKRTAPKPGAEIQGVALLVRNKDQAPAKAALLKTALGAARIVTPIRSDPALPPDSVVLWVGKRPGFVNAAPKP